MSGFCEKELVESEMLKMRERKREREIKIVRFLGRRVFYFYFKWVDLI